MAVVTFAAFLPFILSFISALGGGKPKSVEDYFLFERNLDTGTFATGSVGYSMQVASIFLFLYWFGIYGYWSLIVPLAWFGGYMVQGWFVRTGRLDRFLAADPKNVGTIHGFAANGHGKVLLLLLAVTSMVGFSGTMLAEIDYALTYFVLPGMGLTITAFWAKVTLYVMVLLTAGAYIMWGGYRAAVDNDTVQVKYAFSLFTGTLAFLGIKAVQSGQPSAGLIVGVGLVIFSRVAQLRRKRLAGLDSNYRRSRHDQMLFGVMLAAGLILVGWVLFAHFSSGTVAPSVPSATISKPTSTQPLGFGVLGFIALLGTNLLWQFIDVSSLQRLQSLKYDTNIAADKNRVSEGIFSAGWEGTGSWFMVIGFAIVISATGADVNAPHKAMTGGPLMWCLLPIFLYTVVAFMLSTLDTLVAATAFVVHYDIVPLLPFRRTSIPLDNNGEMRQARKATMFGLLITASIYFYIKFHTQGDDARQSAIVYAIYAIQAAVFGPIFLTVLSPHRLHTGLAILAIGAGWAAAFWSAVSGVRPSWIPEDSWYVLPPFASLAVSFAVAAIGYLVPPVKRAGK